MEGNEYELQYPIGRRVGSVTGLVYMRRILMPMYCRRVIVTRPLGAKCFSCITFPAELCNFECFHMGHWVGLCGMIRDGVLMRYLRYRFDG